MKIKYLNKLKKIFWHYKWNSVLKILTSLFVIARVLEMINIEQVRLFLKIENKGF